MRPIVVVDAAPALEFAPAIRQVNEQLLVQAAVATRSVEALDERGLYGLSRFDEVQLRCLGGTPRRVASCYRGRDSDQAPVDRLNRGKRSPATPTQRGPRGCFLHTSATVGLTNREFKIAELIEAPALAGVPFGKLEKKEDLPVGWASLTVGEWRTRLPRRRAATGPHEM